MPTLNWIGKKAVENHHWQVPFHLLKDVPELSVGNPGSGNLIVEGDNLLALKADYVLANPPFNSDWRGELFKGDKRRVHGEPPAGNANFSWGQQ